MSAKISDAEWARFSSVINEFHNDAFQDVVEWKKPRPYIKRAGEDRPKTFDTLELKGLFFYNYFRTWPITEYTINGEFDKQSEVLLLNVEYLRTNHTVDSSLRLIYSPHEDLFIHRGQVYEATGDSFISQAKDTPLLFMLILKRRDNAEITT